MLSRQQIWVLVAGIGFALVMLICGIWAVWYSMDVHVLPSKPGADTMTGRGSMFN